MDQKLKSLKVVQLRDILTKAQTPAPAKANKQDLIARILATPAALKVYNDQNPSLQDPSTHADDLLAPPEDVDWNDEAVTLASPTAPTASSKPAESKPLHKKVTAAIVEPTVTPASSTTAASTSPGAPPQKPAEPAPTEVDPEIEARKRRAERFGIPLVEPSKPKAPREQSKKALSGAAINAPSTPIDSEDSLKKRAARFGLQTTPTASPKIGQKRAAPPTETVDPEELERRRKRAERFGIKPSS